MQKIILPKYHAPLLGIFAALVLFTTLLITYKNYTPIPWYDEWNGSVAIMQQIMDGNYRVLFALHNEHLHLFQKLVLWLDYALTGRFSNLGIYVNYLLLSLICILFIRFFYKNYRYYKLEDKQSLYLYGFFIVGFLFQYIQGNNLLIRFQCSFFFAILFPLITFYASAKTISDKKWTHFLVSCIFGALTLGAAGMGIFVLPLILLLHLLFVKDYGKIAFLTGFMALVFYYYFQIIKNPESSNAISLQFIVDNIFGLVLFTVKYLGSPFYYLFGKDKLPVGGYAGILFGLGYLVLSVWITLQFLRKKSYQNPFLISLAFFVLYIILAAAVTALGRLSFGTDYAFKTRYTSFTMVGWVALLIIAFFTFENLKKIIFLPFIFVLAQGLMLNLYLLNQNADVNQHLDHCWIGCRHFKNTGGLAAALGVRDSVFLRHIFPPDVDMPLRFAAEAEAKNLRIFGNTIDGLNRQLKTTIVPSSAETLRCAGSIESAEPIPGENTFVRVNGWLFNVTDNKVPKIVKFVSQNGEIVGFALTAHPRSDLKSQFGSSYYRAGFQGYILKAFVGTEIQIYTDDNRTTNLVLPVPGI